MRPVLAGLLTVAILAVVLYAGSRGPSLTPLRQTVSGTSDVLAAESSPEQAVRDLIRASDFGDVEKYLDYFETATRSRLEREVASRGQKAFADDLRKAARTRKAHAVYAALPETDDTARVLVETIYPDRNERQTYRLVRSGETWRVLEVATVRTHQPSERFGASAMPTSPESTPSPRVGLTVESGDDDSP